MLPLVCVGAAVSADVVTSTKLFVMRYNATSLASASLLARDTQFKLSSMVVSFFTLHYSSSLSCIYEYLAIDSGA